MTDPTTWDRLRAALRLDGSSRTAGVLPAVTLEGFAAWAGDQGLKASDPIPDAGDGGDLVEVYGDRRLGHVEGRCTRRAAGVVGVDVAVTGSAPAPAAELAAFLLAPVAAALSDEELGALDTWLRSRLDHGGPSNAATTVTAMQVALSIDDAGPHGRTWAFAARAR